jgi:hypothetical protein
MAKTFRKWKVLQHGPVERLAENLWRVSGSLPGMSLRRTMTIVRLVTGRLVLHNAIALQEDAMKQIESWGKLAYLVVPNGLHRLDAPAYKKRFSGLVVLAPKGSRKKVEEVMTVDATYEDFPADETVRFEPLHGINDVEGAMLVHSPDGVSIVLSDIVFNMDRKRDPLGFFFTTLLGSAPGPRISRLARLVMVKDRAALKEDLLRFAATPGLVRVIVAHEKVAAGPAAAAALRAAARYL